MKKVKVKLLTAMVGNYLNEKKEAAGHFAYSKGDVIEMLESEAKNYVAKGYAVLVN